MHQGYRSTDVDIRSPEDLSELIAFFNGTSAEVRHSCMYGDLHHLILNPDPESIEVDEETGATTMDMSEDVDTMLPALKSAKERFPELFASFTRFDINPGYNAAPEPAPGQPHQHEEITLTPEQMRQISELGATFTVTVYPFDREHPQEIRE